MAILSVMVVDYMGWCILQTRYSDEIHAASIEDLHTQSREIWKGEHLTDLGLSSPTLRIAVSVKAGRAIVISTPEPSSCSTHTSACPSNELETSKQMSEG